MTRLIKIMVTKSKTIPRGPSPGRRPLPGLSSALERNCLIRFLVRPNTPHAKEYSLSEKYVISENQKTILWQRLMAYRRLRLL
jgi:hypothetical protein